MLIGDLARLTGASPRALRHYEEQGLLLPSRTSGGYRDYVDEDMIRVTQIRAMIAAGLGTATIRRYLDCARSGEHGVTVEMCPDLRAELDAITRQIDVKQAKLEETRSRLRRLAGG